jgi:hypothetical protein
MTISATTTGIQITGSTPISISSIVITDDTTTTTLDMNLSTKSGMDAIVAGTSYTLQLSGFFNGSLAFVDPNAMLVDDIKNNIIINAMLNNQVGSTSSVFSSSGKLYKNRDGLIKVSIDYGSTDPNDLVAIDFGLFTPNSKTPILTYSLADSISVDTNFIYIAIPDTDLTFSGRCYVEIVVDTGAKSQLLKSYINVVDTRL